MIGSQEVNSSVEQRPVTERLSLTVARNILPDGDDLTHMWNQYLMIESLPCKDSHLQQTKESRYYSTVDLLHLVPAKERSTLPHESPIRSLCGDRLHVARGIVINSPIAEDQPTLEAPTRVQPPRGRKPSAPKLTGKRQVPEKPPVKNRGPGNPLQGVSLKKRCVCKNQISPRRKTTSTGTNRGPTAPATSLLLSWKDHVEVEVLDSSPNFIDTQITTGVDSTFVTFLYGAPRQEDRASMLEKLTLLGSGRDEAWLVTASYHQVV
ncbi:hypothetical protein F2Q69_00024792 [Brassica cretica]|uniref:Uncharacterized protein n=1 Tax=Brassica cretica TaxID=69181 RepID=A0A8S9QNL9_BRACR|nr:hypothetical protein F2Q69_00024792 [Brassica cretica]